VNRKNETNCGGKINSLTKIVDIKMEKRERGRGKQPGLQNTKFDRGGNMKGKQEGEQITHVAGVR